MQAVTIDVKSIARQRGAHQPRHPTLPPAVLAFTRYWMGLSDQRPPMWPSFQMLNVLELVPYLTVFKCHGDSRFEVEFMGSAVSAMIGEDLTGANFTSSSPTVAEIDWYERCFGAMETRDVSTLVGTANPQYTPKIDYVGADFPFLDDHGHDVSHVVTLTVGKTN